MGSRGTHGRKLQWSFIFLLTDLKIHGGIMQKQRIRIYDIENLPFATYVTIRFVDDAEEKAVVYADNVAFENGNTIKF